MKKLLLITQDEINNENNRSLFKESLNFCKSIAFRKDLTYTQLASFEHENGLLKELLTTYIDTSPRHANIIFDSSNAISLYNTIFPKQANNFYREIFNGRNGITVSSIRKAEIAKDYNSKINVSYFLTNPCDAICNNFDYVILHHGGNNILRYFTTLNQLLFADSDEPMRLSKLILINKNHIFDNLLEQYKSFKKLGIDTNGIHPNVSIVDSLPISFNLLEEDMVYNPHISKKASFTIDD